jgi:putative spermidine/putrescine transport system permease protein
MTRTSPWLLAALAAPVVVLLLAPTLVVIPMSFTEGRILSWPPQGFTFDWYGRLLGSGAWLATAWNSVLVALAATVIALLLGVPAGLTFGLRHWKTKQLALALVVMPLVIPTIVLAIGMYRVYAWLGLGDLWGVAAAHAVIAAPLVVIPTMSAARQINPVLLLAARSLGATPASVFRHVTLPSVGFGVLSGAVFAFVTSWDEVVIAKFLTSPRFRTIPVQMWSQLTDRVDPTVAAMSTLLVAVTSLLMIGLAAVRRSRR